MKTFGSQSSGGGGGGSPTATNAFGPTGAAGVVYTCPAGKYAIARCIVFVTSASINNFTTALNGGATAVGIFGASAPINTQVDVILRPGDNVAKSAGGIGAAIVNVLVTEYDL